MRLLDPFRPPYDLKLVWALVPFALLGMSLGLMPLRSWDYWWHIALGRMIASTHEMPLFNYFLYTLPADTPSYVQAWLSQWALFELHETIGLHGVLVMRTLLGASAWLFMTLWAARRAGNVAVGSIAALSGAVFGFFCVASRTHLLAWPWFLVVTPLLYAVRGRTLPLRALLVLPLVSVLWVNLHGTFLVPSLLGLAFTAAELVHLLLKREVAGAPASWTRFAAFAGATATAAAATLLNPRGIEVYYYLMDLPTNPENLTTVTEWFPTTLAFPPFYGVYFWVVLVGVLALMAWQRSKVDFADLFILLGFSALAIRHNRALLWVGLSLPFVVPTYIAFLGKYFQDSDEAPTRTGQTINVVMAVMLVVGVFAVQPWSADGGLAADLQPIPTRAQTPLRGLVPADTPVEAAARLVGRPGLRIFHDSRYPGFLLYWLDDAQPDQLVFVDNRVELPTNEIWREYDRTCRGDRWAQTFSKYDINAVVASTRGQQGLITALRAAPRWSLDFENEHYVLFLRTADE